MKPERWKQIEDLYQAALEQEPDQRAAFLHSACGEDRDLLREVESLLAAQPQGKDQEQETATQVTRAQPALSLVGQQLGHYRVLSLLGAGGMGQVYLARDTQLDRTVALKVLPPEFALDPDRLQRFIREAKAASALKHSNIAVIHEIEEVDGTHFIVMEHVEGETLEARIRDHRLKLGEILDLGIQIADALDEAHRQGITHRDIKPANLMLTARGQVKVLDFGLAKRSHPAKAGEGTATLTASQTAPGVIMGTLQYMAPEQLLGQLADGRSDLWALGVVLYEMAAGVQPFQGQTGFELSSAILNQPPRPLPAQVPTALRGVIERCLEKEPGRRYQQAGDVRAALEAIRGGTIAPWVAWRYRLAHHRWLVLANALLLVAAVLVGLDVGGLRRWLPSWVATPTFRSLAVLPVANLSGDPEQEYFADGMTDALITDISKIGALKVISRTSVMQYKGVKKPLPEIARDLKVDTVLEASVVREDGRVRVTAQLIEAASDRHLWAESYERELTSILALQSEVARAVARTVRVRLRPQEETRLAGARAVNPATYEAYLRGMFYLNKSTPADIQKGMTYLHEAVEKDPADPWAYAGLALGYIEIAHGADPTEDALQRAKAAAETALKLDDTLAETLAVSGFVKGYYEWKWEEADRDIRRALEVNPSLAIAHYHLSWFHALFGRMKEAIEEHKRAKELDPFNPLHTAWLGELYRWERRYDEASTEALKSIEMDPQFPVGYYVLGLVYQDKGEYDKAIAATQKAAEADPDWRWALGPTYVAAGRREEARKLLAELKQRKVIPWNAFWLVALHAALGENDEAFRWLNYERQHAWIPWVRVLTWYGLEALRNDPRFSDQLRRMNLPPLPKSGVIHATIYGHPSRTSIGKPS
jgi:serine/threonine-protein kinase